MSEAISVVKEQYFAHRNDFRDHVAKAFVEGTYVRFEESSSDEESPTAAESRGEFSGGIVITTSTAHRLTTVQRLWSVWHSATTTIRRLVDRVRL